MGEPTLDEEEMQPKVKRSPVIESDSDGEELPKKEDPGSLGDNDSDDEPVVRSARRKKRINRSFLDDSDDDETPKDTGGGSRESSKSRSRSRSPAAEATDRSPVDSTDDIPKDAENSLEQDTGKDGSGETSTTATSTPAPKKFFKLSEINSDLFDSDSESDNDKENRDASGSSDNEGTAENRPKSDGEGRDESSDEESVEMSAALKRRLKQGAAKTEKSRPDRASKPKRDQLTEVYGESQRLVRESDLRLPYHKPQPPALSGFLAKMQQKQSQLGYLKKTPGKSWKNMHVMHSQVTPPKIDLTKSTPLKEKTHNVVTEEQPLKTDKLKIDDKDSDNELGEDELPDLCTRLTASLKNKVNNDTSCDVEIKENTEVAKTDTSKDKAKVPEQDSGYLTTPGLSSEEENSSEPMNNDKGDLVNTKTMDSDTKVPNGETTNNGNDTDAQNEVHFNEGGQSSSKAASYDSHSGKKADHSGLSQELSAFGVCAVKPTLSGGPDWMIDLDDDPPKKKPSGVNKLMERLMKHSTKRSAKKGHDIELSAVEVDKDEVTGKEELKMKKVTIHVDGEEEDDPNLQQPGAKLVKLKETLAAEMARKRAELRREKSQMYDLENEEGFNMDDEAELTDQTDTDEDEAEEPDEDEMMEEEELEEQEDVIEEQEKEENPFVDDEAEDEDEEHMHLELDEDAEDDDSNPITEEKEEKLKKSKEYLRTALQKTKTVDLFDDDAFNDSDTIKSGCEFLTSGADMSTDDSITLSQNNRKERIELSDRPFKSLSQEKRPNSVEEYLKVIENENDSLEEDSTLEKDSSLDETSAPTADLSHSKLSLFDKDGSSMASNDASFDSVASSLIQPGQRMSRRETPDLFTPSSRGSIAACSTANKSSRKFSELTMPIEDTQDLLKCSPASESTPRIGAPNLSFSLDDSSNYSQMLDADGLFKLNSSGKKAARRQLELGSLLRGTQDNEDELLELCSGKFTGGNAQDGMPKGAFSGLSQLVTNSGENNEDDELLALCSGQFTGADKPKTQKAKPFLQTQTSHDGNVNELLDLCSGQFTESKSPEKKKVKGKKRRIVDDSDKEEEEDFEIASDAGAQSDHDADELASDTEKPDSDDEEEQQRRSFKSAFKGLRSKKGKLRRDFLDEEAELSGSECGSDEDLDLDERDDVMEEELGDLEDLPSDDELRNQVGRVHLKKMIDEDKRELRLYQEMYLADGDLHTEGSGRQRKFRWKNVDDDDTQQDMFNSDDEKEDVEEEADHKWRMERFEREKFIKEKEAETEEESGSQLVKLGKAVFKPKIGKQTSVQAPPAASTPVTEKPAPEVPKNSSKSPKNLFKVPSLKRSTHGSFLSRSRDTLAKIAEMTKPISNPTGPRNSRNFVFSTVDKDEAEESEEPVKPQPVKRSNSVPASSSASKPAKRQKLERSSSVLPQNSVFHHFD